MSQSLFLYFHFAPCTIVLTGIAGNKNSIGSTAKKLETKCSKKTFGFQLFRLIIHWQKRGMLKNVRGGGGIKTPDTLISTLTSISIPLHGVAVAAALVILQRVGERGGIAAEREIVARVRSEHHLAAHVETVEVTLERGRRH